jgi:hypothetical protein
VERGSEAEWLVLFMTRGQLERLRWHLGTLGGPYGVNAGASVLERGMTIPMVKRNKGREVNEYGFHYI